MAKHSSLFCERVKTIKVLLNGHETNNKKQMTKFDSLSIFLKFLNFLLSYLGDVFYYFLKNHKRKTLEKKLKYFFRFRINKTKPTNLKRKY